MRDSQEKKSAKCQQTEQWSSVEEILRRRDQWNISRQNIGVLWETIPRSAQQSVEQQTNQKQMKPQRSRRSWKPKRHLHTHTRNYATRHLRPVKRGRGNTQSIPLFFTHTTNQHHTTNKTKETVSYHPGSKENHLQEIWGGMDQPGVYIPINGRTNYGVR